MLGGLCCCLLLCVCCFGYYGSQYIMEWRAKQKRMKPTSQAANGNDKFNDESESDFDRSRQKLRGNK